MMKRTLWLVVDQVKDERKRQKKEMWNILRIMYVCYVQGAFATQQTFQVEFFTQIC